MVCPVQIIVFQKLRSFFILSGPTLSCNYHIIVYLATLCRWQLQLAGVVLWARAVPVLRVYEGARYRPWPPSGHTPRHDAAPPDGPPDVMLIDLRAPPEKSVTLLAACKALSQKAYIGCYGSASNFR